MNRRELTLMGKTTPLNLIIPYYASEFYVKLRVNYFAVDEVPDKLLTNGLATLNLRCKIAL